MRVKCSVAAVFDIELPQDMSEEQRLHSIAFNFASRILQAKLSELTPAVAIEFLDDAKKEGDDEV